ncbi:hypothetical protein NESM_000832500 [Novymonas esmeraldas]|uniref:C3H1-type domain-containing protein n=1 Tax=Novymonas esmeraldas TaxID=1808958 RepID=A0AAW0EXF5_9TRYP
MEAVAGSRHTNPLALDATCDRPTWTAASPHASAPRSTTSSTAHRRATVPLPEPLSPLSSNTEGDRVRAVTHRSPPLRHAVAVLSRASATAGAGDEDVVEVNASSTSSSTTSLQWHRHNPYGNVPSRAHSPGTDDSGSPLPLPGSVLAVSHGGTGATLQSFTVVRRSHSLRRSRGTIAAAGRDGVLHTSQPLPQHHNANVPHTLVSPLASQVRAVPSRTSSAASRVSSSHCSSSHRRSSGSMGFLPDVDVVEGSASSSGVFLLHHCRLQLTTRGQSGAASSSATTTPHSYAAVETFFEETGGFAVDEDDAGEPRSRQRSASAHHPPNKAEHHRHGNGNSNSSSNSSGGGGEAVAEARHTSAPTSLPLYAELQRYASTSLSEISQPCRDTAVATEDAGPPAAAPGAMPLPSSACAGSAPQPPPPAPPPECLSTPPPCFLPAVPPDQPRAPQHTQPQSKTPSGAAALPSFTAATLTDMLTAHLARLSESGGADGAAAAQEVVWCPAGSHFSVYDSGMRQHFLLRSEEVAITCGAIRYVSLYERHGNQTRFRFQLCNRHLHHRCSSGAACPYIHSVELSATTRVHMNENCITNVGVRTMNHVELAGGRNTLGYATVAPGLLFAVYPPNRLDSPPQLIPSECVLRTQGAMQTCAALVREAAGGGGVAGGGGIVRPRHCAHFQFKRMCNLGAACHFIHALTPFVQGMVNQPPLPMVVDMASISIGCGAGCVLPTAARGVGGALLDLWSDAATATAGNALHATAPPAQRPLRSGVDAQHSRGVTVPLAQPCVEAVHELPYAQPAPLPPGGGLVGAGGTPDGAAAAAHDTRPLHPWTPSTGPRDGGGPYMAATAAPTSAGAAVPATAMRVAPAAPPGGVMTFKSFTTAPPPPPLPAALMVGVPPVLAQQPHAHPRATAPHHPRRASPQPLQPQQQWIPITSAALGGAPAARHPHHHRYTTGSPSRRGPA